MDPRDPDFKKKLDEVIGTRYDETASKTLLEGAKRRAAKWLLGVLFAVAAASTVVAVIESHRLPPENARPVARKPVPIQIIPEPKEKRP